jgi:mannose-6-phosphate isomerase-like protein (cupin superfamily)
MSTGRQGSAGWVAVHVDAVEAIPWRGTELVWRPVRTALGTRIVGMSAYTAERVGQEVVEDHVEGRDGRDHDEVYVVLRGRATFRLDEESLDAPAGTFVSVPASVRRQAVAAEPGTTVLALGGPSTFEPAGSDWIERARPHMRDRPVKARAILEELRAERPDSPGLLFGEALLHASQGDEVAARNSLRAAIDRAPVVRAHAQGEPLLAPLLEGLE